MATNKLQRRLRRISNEHCDDTAVEMDCLEVSQHTYHTVQVALLDGVITANEANDIMNGLGKVIYLAEDSLRRNVIVEQQLTAFSHDLSGGPADIRVRQAAA